MFLECSLNVPREVVQQLMECGLVVSTSLHGLIFAEAYSIPARWVRSASLPSHTEGTHKFNDHLTSTGM
jgi:pyruvyltransferase